MTNFRQDSLLVAAEIFIDKFESNEIQNQR